MIAAVIVAFLVGALVGRLVTRRRAYLVCQRQALVDNAFRPAISDGFNPVPPRQRRRSPDSQPLWQQFSDRVRPVFHDDRR
ncbi:hypothetical protein FHR83_006631 [Actinoplanes campanulatus]|uniref:Uncharacterized protein n=1 Tax=Actinoplanes campanulatus TaxID=113559 RepID=A0A7W5AML9_9ACTN|nr:hypothetical protein [Actinoplanes campanulatus]MBB3098925.1 hypothetical protein [Actinoplanes campanulatus]GGN39823.1 hypothetical protein GCM10010109_68250 [Actinoplanes campanulatus]GID40129.1 hypothetical protein Aca09nite_66350 [Actinoplanes campanulatus]